MWRKNYADYADYKTEINRIIKIIYNYSVDMYSFSYNLIKPEACLESASFK